MAEANLGLITACINKDTRAQTKLYELYKPKIRAYVIYYYNDGLNEVDDVISMTFKRVFEWIHTFEHKGSFGGWIMRIAKHCIADHVKANKRHKINRYMEDISGYCGAADAFINVDFGVYEKMMLETLTKREYAVFKLYVDGYKHREIGKTLNINSETSKWMVSNARKKLKEKISQINLVV